MQNKFHLRVRAIIPDKDNGHVLVARERGGSHTFLPGGHHEIGESLKAALIREIKEEIGITAEVVEYIGFVENDWTDGDMHHYEINHIFVVHIEENSSDRTFLSQEDHLEFLWLAVDNFDKQNLLPESIRQPLASFFTGKGDVWAIDSSKS